VWRDMESNSLAAAADAAGKLRQNVEAPVQALWEELPGMTQQKLARWKEQHEEEDSELRMMEQLSRASGSRPDTSTSGRSVDS
jgi:hypothetical protein